MSQDRHAYHCVCVSYLFKIRSFHFVVPVIVSVFRNRHSESDVLLICDWLRPNKRTTKFFREPGWDFKVVFGEVSASFTYKEESIQHVPYKNIQVILLYTAGSVMLLHWWQYPESLSHNLLSSELTIRLLTQLPKTTVETGGLDSSQSWRPITSGYEKRVKHRPPDRGLAYVYSLNMLTLISVKDNRQIAKYIFVLLSTWKI